MDLTEYFICNKNHAMKKWPIFKFTGARDDYSGFISSAVLITNTLEFDVIQVDASKTFSDNITQFIKSAE